MKKFITAVLCLLSIVYLSPQQVCEASLFEMALAQDSIYTPGKITLALKLTDEAEYQGYYQFRISFYMAGDLVRKQTLTAAQNESVRFELSFPEVFSRTDCRCRCELFIGDDFFEALEKSFTLWPPTAPYSGESIRDKEIWTFDTSGRLQELFDILEVEATDATYQPAREFGSPDIVLIGQNTEPNSVRIITERLVPVEPKPLIIYLKQKQLIRELKLEIPAENNHPQSVTCDANGILLNGLNMVDMMRLVDDALFVKIKKDRGSDGTIKSFVTESIKDQKNIFSYLFTIENRGQKLVFCQLPVTDRKDPRCAILLKNILKFSVNFIDSREKQINPDNERR